MNFEVLIIDDDESFRHLLQLRIKSFIPNLGVTVFDRLDQARKFLEANKSKSFDLVILDQHLPDGKGIELLTEGWFQELAVLSVSSDDAPEIPGASLQAGAAYFLNKKDISEALFKPLVQGIIDRNKLQHKLDQSKVDAAVIKSVKTLLDTLRHEINNPLGAVLGAAYLLRNNDAASEDQKQAAELVELSGHRIKHVLDELCQTVKLKSVTKANHEVFQIPGDEPWEKE